MRRRNFITLLGSTMVMGSLAAHAQQSGGMRRVGVLMAHPESDPVFQQYADAFREGLRKLGWVEGRNVSFDFRWGALDDSDIRSRSAKELVGLQPDLILTQNTPPTASMLQQTRSIPVIFVIVADPVGSGFVKSLSHNGADDCWQMGAVAQRDRAAGHPRRPSVQSRHRTVCGCLHKAF